MTGFWLPLPSSGGSSGGGSGVPSLLVRDGIIPLEPVGMDGDSDVWLYADAVAGTSGGGGSGVTDHGELDGLADNDHPLYVQGQDGRSYRMLSAVIRKSGGSWGYIDDASHRPVGFSGISASSTGINLTYDFTATYVGSVIVAPDETYAATYTCGASVARTNLTIEIYNSAGSLVNPSTMADSASGNFWILGLMEV